MQSSEAEIVILGLNRAEALDLKRHQQSAGGARLEERSVESAGAGVLDPVTLVVLPLAVIALQGLIAWLLKDRHEENVKQEVEIRRSDGTVERRIITIQNIDSVTSEQVAEIIGSLKVPTIQL